MSGYHMTGNPHHNKQNHPPDLQRGLPQHHRVKLREPSKGVLQRLHELLQCHLDAKERVLNGSRHCHLVQNMHQQVHRSKHAGRSRRIRVPVIVSVVIHIRVIVKAAKTIRVCDIWIPILSFRRSEIGIESPKSLSGHCINLLFHRDFMSIAVVMSIVRSTLISRGFCAPVEFSYESSYPRFAESC
ncbi:hypothetical protein BC829DRAFT_204893 [Chytridium lagenaria]|nr:hypothetical protein BC829DRAFT_204893 [Chytridium lagenaria]